MQLLAKTHARKSQELQRKVKRLAANNNAFDMRKLEQEIQAIQTGELASLPHNINESYAILSAEVNIIIDVAEYMFGSLRRLYIGR